VVLAYLVARDKNHNTSLYFVHLWFKCIFSFAFLQCFDSGTVGWMTGRISSL